jgi:hypothetical protein
MPHPIEKKEFATAQDVVVRYRHSSTSCGRRDSSWETRMMIKAFLRIFKTGVTLMEKIENGIDIE